jgi:DNA-directed RNA polymerase subunit RPC12/RpoP
MLDQVLELRVLRILQCPHCGERIARLKPVEEITTAPPPRRASE